MTEQKLKMIMPMISDSDLKLAKVINSSTAEFEKYHKAEFLAIICVTSNSLKTMDGINLKGRSKKAMIVQSAESYKNYSTMSLTGICTALRLDYHKVQQILIKALNWL